MFPVDQILPAINASLAAGRNVVLQAPPGSGKTTRVPPFLFAQGWMQGRKILMLEPRRLAARAAAAYMARQAGESAGETIGYHVRLERRVSRATRVEIITEGILTQRLLSDPELADTALVIFDEFHERSLAADTALAICLEIRQALRPDLRLMVMSATLQPDAIAAHIGSADIHTAESRLYPVETLLLPRPSSRPAHVQAAEAVMRCLRDASGGILVFLPGEREIRACCRELDERGVPPGVRIHPLYAALPPGEQDAAIAPPPDGVRKVVVATSVAESSLTIEDVRVVIDSGLMRVPRFSPRLGMPRLETLMITRDRADQRRGRAGRVGPGLCLRLWDAVADRQLGEESTPEILDADLSATVLQCAEWGGIETDSLPWLTPPPSAAWRRAVALLRDLEALESGADGRLALTPRGRAMARIPTHPRLAHMIIAASESGGARSAAFIAALISERSTSGQLRRITDVAALIAFIAHNAHSRAARSVQRLADQWSAGFKGRQERQIDAGVLLAWAFPDRVARRRGNRGVYLLQSGQGAVLDTAEPLANEEWLVAAELHDEGANTRIRLAAAIAEEQVHSLFEKHFTSCGITEWERRSEAVTSVTRTAFGAIVIREAPCRNPDAVAVTAALMSGVRIKGVDQLPWSKSAQSLRERVTFLSRALPDQGWPVMTDAALAAALDEWLAPACAGITRWSQLQRLEMFQVVSNSLILRGFDLRALDRAAPTHIQVPSGSSIRLSYDAEQPYLRVRIQEVFGLMQTPRIAGGRVPVVMHLLSPAQRPVQVTQDLQSFWNSSYALVRKDMRGRYPKHYWPEDPLQAEPTQRRTRDRS